ncbi:hypothetical protein NPIL_315431 [Nephila pilipes]|uniref:Uncharacterized protein n=1 Tax=Nephila pilipes TaxID=299642 RepID=A0A8X6Q3S5_NEPPI|nr:hypothetical protein NPIL_315431 [Nephila pilipes]
MENLHSVWHEGLITPIKIIGGRISNTETTRGAISARALFPKSIRHNSARTPLLVHYKTLPKRLLFVQNQDMKPRAIKKSRAKIKHSKRAAQLGPILFL